MFLTIGILTDHDCKIGKTFRIRKCFQRSLAISRYFTCFARNIKNEGVTIVSVISDIKSKRNVPNIRELWSGTNKTEIHQKKRLIVKPIKIPYIRNFNQSKLIGSCALNLLGHLGTCLLTTNIVCLISCRWLSAFIYINGWILKAEHSYFNHVIGRY